MYPRMTKMTPDNDLRIYIYIYTMWKIWVGKYTVKWNEGRNKGLRGKKVFLGIYVFIHVLHMHVYSVLPKQLSCCVIKKRFVSLSISFFGLCIAENNVQRQTESLQGRGLLDSRIVVMLSCSSSDKWKKIKGRKENTTDLIFNAHLFIYLDTFATVV